MRLRPVRAATTPSKPSFANIRTSRVWIHYRVGGRDREHLSLPEGREGKSADEASRCGEQGVREGGGDGRNGVLSESRGTVLRHEVAGLRRRARLGEDTCFPVEFEEARAWRRRLISRRRAWDPRTSARRDRGSPGTPGSLPSSFPIPCPNVSVTRWRSSARTFRWAAPSRCAEPPISSRAFRRRSA